MAPLPEPGRPSRTPLPDEPVALRRALEEERHHRHALEQRLRAAHRLEAVGRLASGIAHDFNNLLTAIVSHASLADVALDDDHPARGDLVGIRSAAARASELVRRLLAFSHSERTKPQVVAMDPALRRLGSLLRRLIDERIDLRLETSAARDLWVEVDPSQLDQVVVNLVVNARDAMPGGGVLTVRAGPTEADPDVAEVCVSDTGVGIDPTVLERIFEPYFSTKREHGGTGLGLATSRDIIAAAGGSLTVSSTPGSGATFRIALPRVARPGRPAPERPDATALPRGSETILLVEDEHLVRSATSRILRRLGYDVVEAEDGAQAEGMLAARPDFRVDLLVTDVVMPRIGGLELATDLRRVMPDLRVLFVSGYHAEDELGPPPEHDDEEVTATRRRVPDADHLPKPFTFQELAVKVREVLDRDR